VSEDWLGRWAEGRTGWHETGGNAALRAHWPATDNPGSVLVPLCGKTPDLLWLARRGHRVCGVEMSPLAVEAFFADHDLTFRRETDGPLVRYAAAGLPLEIICGDYFDFSAAPFAALYDRAALVAMPPELRPRYVEHTRRLLEPGALRLIVTLEYDQRVVDGPPFSVGAAEIAGYWDDLERVADRDDIANCPPKFLKAGLSELREVCWRSR